MGYCDEVTLPMVHGTYATDVFFPAEIFNSLTWKLVSRQEFEGCGGVQGILHLDGARPPGGGQPAGSSCALNAELDVRRKRRALEADEFSRLVAAAASGPPVQEVSGPDRAMLYVLAARTGYRRRELSSVTTRSLDLDATPATVRVEAAYSKRRRHDVVPLHPVVALRLKAWLAARGLLNPDQPLFPLRCPGGGLRRTSKMMWLDLERARVAWIGEAESTQERAERERSDYLSYRGGRTLRRLSQ